MESRQPEHGGLQAPCPALRNVWEVQLQSVVLAPVSWSSAHPGPHLQRQLSVCGEEAESSDGIISSFTCHEKF